MFLGLSFRLFFHYYLTTSYQNHLLYHYHIPLLMTHHHSHSFLSHHPQHTSTGLHYWHIYVLYWILRRHSMEAGTHVHLLNSCTLVYAQYEFCLNGIILWLITVIVQALVQLLEVLYKYMAMLQNISILVTLKHCMSSLWLGH